MAVLAGDVEDGSTDATEGMSVAITEDGNPGVTPALSAWYAEFVSHGNCPNDATVTGASHASVGYSDVVLYGEGDMSATVSTIMMASCIPGYTNLVPRSVLTRTRRLRRTRSPEVWIAWGDAGSSMVTV